MNAARYFTDGVSFWKFAPGEYAKHRYRTDPEWDESAFEDVEEFLAASNSPGVTIREVTSGEAEP